MSVGVGFAVEEDVACAGCWQHVSGVRLIEMFCQF